MRLIVRPRLPGQRLRRLFCATLLVAAPGVIATASESSDPAAGAEFFESRIRPLLVEHCYECHSARARRIKGDLLLDAKAGWQKGGTSGKPAIVPGNPDASLLIQAVRQTHEDLAMPPKARLEPQQIADLEHWVRLGAPDPRTAGLNLPDPQDAARSHWAFQPVREPPVPEVRDRSWPRNPIDHFILAPMEEKGLNPAPQAGKRTLIRRATLLLTGLPPTIHEVAAFEADDSPHAFERVVDRLLSSPRYGERWGRHWLDVARYADSKGYVFEEERRYPYAYTYRDYVIRAFNEDKPYDEFLIEQIAADLIVRGEDRAALAAMGFLTLGRRFLNNQHDIIDDRIDVVTRGTLALTVTCARCHDHKYDPIPTADYYSLYGVFASSEEPDEKPLLGMIPNPELYREFQSELARRETERDEFIATKEAEHRKNLRESIGEYLRAAHEAAQLEEDKREEFARGRQLSPVVLNNWVRALDRWRSEGHPLFNAWLQFDAVPEAEFGAAAARIASEIAANLEGRHDSSVASLFAGMPPESLKDVADRYSRLLAEPPAGAVRDFLSAKDTPIDLDRNQLQRLFNVQESQRKRALQRAVDQLHATHPGAPPRGMALVDKAEPVEPVIFQRGNPRNRGDRVPRQIPELLAGPDRHPFTQGSGRLELARAIASPDNPLTARVAVNRIWLHHFGAGLVRTLGDFGLRSDPPSHPELLDWLAARFVREGWSMKRLHRLILSSATWQQSSEVSPAAAQSDPDNRLLSHANRRRLDFEAMRDTLLSAGGHLDLAMGGHAVEITTREYAPRRTVYGFVERQNLPGLFRTFDFASPDTTSPRRFETTVPQQALFFMNSPFSLDQARELISRPEIAAQTDVERRVALLYQIVFQRKPAPAEVRMARRFLSLPAEGMSEDYPLPPTWHYGHGAIDLEREVITEFQPLPHFTGKSWQGGPELPDPKLGWLSLTATGGHPGGPKHGPVIRRWTSPGEGAVEISGRLRHGAEAGDGIHAFIVSSRHGLLGKWQIKQDSERIRVENVQVLPGDTLDFVVACGKDENSDSFEWAPRIRRSIAGSGSPRFTARGLAGAWDAAEDFAGSSDPPAPLDPWERYAQVLLMTNEAMFID
jgi:mono/diheme cytochrome c family protein